VNIKLVVAGVILLPVLAHLGYSLANSSVTNYYVTVDEYVSRSATAPVRVAGEVVPGTIQWDNATRTMRFQVSGGTNTLDVMYRGYVPDSFRDGTTVILEGSRGSSNVFVASGVAVKCPHQYLPAG
jgi:cytochrome c-type biogenesis protein CcmE